MVDDGWWLDDRCSLLMTTSIYCRDSASDDSGEDDGHDDDDDDDGDDDDDDDDDGYTGVCEEL